LAQDETAGVWWFFHGYGHTPSPDQISS